MGRAVVRVTPFGGFDIPGLEGWLAAMAARGLRFSMTTGPLTWFEKTEAEPVQIRLEPVQAPADGASDRKALYEKAGWCCWGTFRGSLLVFASPASSAQACASPEIPDHVWKQFFRQKVLAGLLLALLGLLLLGLYHRGAPWEVGLAQLRSFPVEVFSNGATLPFLLALCGLLLVGLSYLLGLSHLARFCRGQHEAHGHRGVGWLLAVGLLFLLPVLADTAQHFSGWDYRPYGLEGSGFVTLTDIEGPDLILSGDPTYTMDTISHGGTVLDPQSWYFRQYGSWPADGGPGDVPHLELSITRYPLEILAELRAEELGRQHMGGSGDGEALAPAFGLDEIRYTAREGQILAGGTLILRRGDIVLLADYRGTQDIRGYLDRFSAMMAQL